jgi:hypothetical protein
MIWTEWDPLEKIIIGRSYIPGDIDWAIDESIRDSFNIILEETNQDLDNLSKFLTDRNVEVFRPTVSVYNNVVNHSNFKISLPTAPIIPRDQYLVYGNTVYQTYTSMPDRYQDSINYYSIFQQLFDNGANWISQPPPVLTNLDHTKNWWEDGGSIYNNYSDRMLWHTATMFKCGDTLITNTAGPGTSRGLAWMQRNLPNANIIDNRHTRMENWGHIDHGWFMTDDDTVFCKSKRWVPVSLRNKTIIEIGKYITPFKFQEYVGDFSNTAGKFSPEWINKYLNQWKGYMQETHFDTNVLVLDSKNILFANEQPKLFKFIEGLGINCHVALQRHGMFWDAGIHCLTLDIQRKGLKRSIIK